jgi:hypothetical protein
MVHRNIDAALRYHEFVMGLNIERSARGTGKSRTGDP